MDIGELKAGLARITLEIEAVIATSGGAPIRGGGCLVYNKSVLEDYNLEGRVGKVKERPSRTLSNAPESSLTLSGRFLKLSNAL